MSDTLKDLQARATAAQADADAATAAAQKLANEANLVLLNAKALAEAARMATDEVATEQNKQAIEAAKNALEVLHAESHLAEADAATAAKLAQDKAAAAAIVRSKVVAAHAKVQALVSDTSPGSDFVRLEGGGFTRVNMPFGQRDLTVTGVNGLLYDHVSDHASGAWIYRARGTR